MDNLIVNVEQGQLRGREALDHFGGTYYSFQGIPYAKPPLGKLRFKAPQPPEPWEGVRDATEEGNECFSHHMVLRHIVGSEDCLFLNIYTPQLPNLDKPPQLKTVMVWIHGGGFTSGSSKTEIYGPDFLMAEDVVVVTINYRTGMLGFLSLKDTSLGVLGNAGLKDMVMALKWVQKNIKRFQGDPNNVTIFGESAGGAAVHYLMLSPLAKGLFHKVVAQSGCALNIWAHGSQCAREAAEKIGFKSLSEKDALEYLQSVPVEKIIEAQDRLYDGVTADRRRPMGPVIEKAVPGEEAFLTEDPADIILSGNYSKVPFMTGFTDREGMLFDISYQRSGEPRLISDFECYIPYQLNLPKGSDLSLKMASKIRKFYFGDQEISMDNIDSDYLLRTDLFFLRGIHKSVIYHMLTSTSPVYLYRVTIESELSFYKKFTKTNVKGVCHADELGYLWKTFITPTIKEGSPEYNTVKRMTKLWANFAKYGDPNPKQQDPLINVTWKPVEKGNLHFLDIGENLTTGVNPEMQRMQFWDELYSLVPTASKL